MKIKTLALAACLSMPLQLVNADIAADFKAGMDAKDVIAKAVAEGMSIAEAVAAAVAANPKAAEAIVAAAVAANPSAAKAIVAAAVAANPSAAEAIAAAAIGAGANPTDVTAATAAGTTTALAALNSNPAARRIAQTPAPGAVSGGGASQN